MAHGVHHMGRSLRVEAQADKYFRAALLGLGLELQSVRQCKEHRRRGVDYTAALVSQRTLWLEHKVDGWAAQTGNLPAEMFSLRTSAPPAMGWLLTCEASVLSFWMKDTRVLLHLSMADFRAFALERLSCTNYSVVAAENPRHTTLSLLLPWQEVMKESFACVQDLQETMPCSQEMPRGFDPACFSARGQVLEWLERQSSHSAPAPALAAPQMQALVQRCKNPGSKRSIAKCWLPE